MDIIGVVAFLAELGDVYPVGVLEVAVLARFAGLPLVGPGDLEVILQGAVFYSLPEAADAGEEFCHFDAHLDVLVGLYSRDQSRSDVCSQSIGEHLITNLQNVGIRHF